jgi:hypothetical protein
VPVSKRRLASATTRRRRSPDATGSSEWSSWTGGPLGSELGVRDAPRTSTHLALETQLVGFRSERGAATCASRRLESTGTSLGSSRIGSPSGSDRSGLRSKLSLRPSSASRSPGCPVSGRSECFHGLRASEVLLRSPAVRLRVPLPISRSRG